MGCEHAPYEQVEEIIAHAGQYINPFPIICKGTIEEIDGIVQAYDIYRNREYRTSVLDIEHILRLFKEDPQHGLFPMGSASYPINFVVQAIAFLLAGHYGKLGGVRVKGSQDDIFDTYLRTKELWFAHIEIDYRIFSLNTPAKNVYFFEKGIDSTLWVRCKLIVALKTSFCKE